MAQSQYQAAETEQVVSFWAAYNRHLPGLCRRLPPGALDREVRLGGETRTVAWPIVDYVAHLEHHLRQLLP